MQISTKQRIAVTLGIIGLPRGPSGSHLRQRLELAALAGQLWKERLFSDESLDELLGWLETSTDEEVAWIWSEEAEELTCSIRKQLSEAIAAE